MTTIPRDDYGAAIQAIRPDAATKAVLGVTSAKVYTVPDGVKAVRIATDGDAFLRFNAAASDTTGTPLFAKQPEVFGVKSGDELYMVAVTGTPNVWITPASKYVVR